MPEYLAPGVYIEEVSYRSKTIEGVSTSTAGMIGPTRFGPAEGRPELLTSFAEFERIYGGLDRLKFEGASDSHNYLAHGVRAFFEEGGSRLYISRTWKAGSTSEGIAKGTVPNLASPPADHIALQARYPGAGGNLTLTFTVNVSRNVLHADGDQKPVLRGVRNYDVVWVADLTSPIASAPGSGTLYWIQEEFDDDNNRWTWGFFSQPNQSRVFELYDGTLTPAAAPGQGDTVLVLSADVQIDYPGEFERTEVWENLGLHPEHRQSIGRTFGKQLSNRLRQLTVPLVVDPDGSATGLKIAEVLLNQTPSNQAEASPPATIGDGLDQNLSSADRQFTVVLKGGNDGARPGAEEYKGQESDDPEKTSGLEVFEGIPDISIVAAPGSTYGYENGYQSHADQIIRHLISHCERMRYRIGVIDSAQGHALSQVRDFRATIDTKHAALYYPWITVLDPITQEEIQLPPSSAVCGIYARNDVQHGVHKAPANEVVRGAIGLEFMLNKAQQDVLNPLGINCLRFFRGRGYRVWGARTATSDPEWKYVNLRRYFAYLERSIERGTQWAVFENNGDALWANVRRTIEDFLLNEWQSGHLFGRTPEEAYFVRCDRSTMTQNDIDNGRLICLIGVAPLRPAEFVIFRIGQWTADAR